MNKDTALANVDKFRELISRLPDDVRILGTDIDCHVEGEHVVAVHVSYPLSALGKNYAVYAHSSEGCRFEHRYYPAGDLEDAGYIYLAKREEAGK